MDDIQLEVQFGGKPAASVVMVDPATAERWLVRNVRNRPVRKRIVADYARDMLAGQWKLTGEAIKFSASGALLDGQHRLAAVVQSGCTVPMFVVRGLPEDAQAAMDTGAKRTASDVLNLAGERHTSVLAAACRLGVLFETTGDPDGNNRNPTHAEIQSFLDKNPDIRYAAEFASSSARRTDCPPATVAYTFWVLSWIDADDALAFWTAAADKVGLRPRDPVIALTNRFAEARRNREVLPRRSQISLIYRAWNARRRGESLRFLRVNSSAGGLVPIPEPK